MDFADVKTVMSEKGIAMMGTGRASGNNRAEVAGTMAVKSELLEDINLKNARGVLVNITAKPTLGDQAEVADIVDEIVSEDANIIYGLVYDDSFGDDLQVTIVATGVDQRAPSLAIDNEPTMKLNPVGLNKHKTNQEVGTSSAEEIDFLDVPTFMRASRLKMLHFPVLLEESIDFLIHDIDGHYIDCTFGRGGHSKNS